MYSFIFLFFPLRFHIVLDGTFISMPPNCINIKPFRPKLASPQFTLNFRMFLENLLCRYTFYYTNYFGRAFNRNTLNQKMNVVFISTYLYKNYIVSLRNFYTNFFQTQINRFTKNNSPIFCRTHKMI